MMLGRATHRVSIGGPGLQVAHGLKNRAARVEACLALGPPYFVRVVVAGYDHALERCAGCLTLRRQHVAEIRS